MSVGVEDAHDQQEAAEFLNRERRDDILVATEDISDPRARASEAAIVSQAFDDALHRVLLAFRLNEARK